MQRWEEGKEKCERQMLTRAGTQGSNEGKRETKEKGEREWETEESQKQTDRLLFPLQIEERKKDTDNAKVLKPVAGAVSGENFTDIGKHLRKIWIYFSFTLT